MPLIKCPECNHDISDKATACPHCGYPMNTPTSTKPRVRNGKPTKLPNGFGCVYKLPGKRRNPFRAIKTDKWIYDPVTGKSKQVRFTIGYYPTREAAMIALSNYNENPYDIKGARNISQRFLIIPVCGPSRRHTLIVTIFIKCGCGI